MVLTPGSAPPLADVLRDLAALPLPSPVYEPEEPELPPVQRIPRNMWYEDSELRRLHGEQTRAGMRRARELGKRLGRPRIDALPGFEQTFAPVIGRISSGQVTRTEAAKELGISTSTLKRVIDTWDNRQKKPLTCPLPDSDYNADIVTEVSY